MRRASALTMHFRRTIVNAEGADVAIDPLHHGVAGDADRSEDLHATIDDTASASEQNTFTMLVSLRRVVLIQQPGRLPDRQRQRWMSISLSASMKPTPWCSPIARPNEWRRPACSTAIAWHAAQPPASACNASAARAEPDLSIAKPLPDLTQHPVRRHAHIVERHFRVSAGDSNRWYRANGPVESRRVISTRTWSPKVGAVAVQRSRHHDVDRSLRDSGYHVFLTVMRKSSPSRRATVSEATDRSGAIGHGFGHGEDRADFSAHSGASQRAFWAGVATTLSS